MTNPFSPLRLPSIEKFSKFSRLLEMNVHAMESSCLHLSNTNMDMLNSINLLGRDIQRFTKGLQPTTGGMLSDLLSDRVHSSLLWKKQKKFLLL